MLEKLGCFIDKHKGDEKANIDLAIELCESENHEGIKEIVGGLTDKNTAVSNDCIKVLYEVGYRKPELISDYCQEFISLLSSKNNRLIWGAMIALKTITPVNPNEVFANLDIIMDTYKKGSTITVDNAISVLSVLASTSVEHEKEIFPTLIDHLENCEVNYLPQRAERVVVCINDKNKNLFLKTLEKRVDDLSSTQLARINKLKKKLG